MVKTLTAKLLRAASSRRLACKAPKAALPMLSTKKCWGITSRLGDVYMSGLPFKSQELAKRLKQGLSSTRGKRHLEPEKATSILGKLLREVNTGLQSFVEEAAAVVKNADMERQTRAAAIVAAETRVSELRHGVTACISTVKETLQSIEDRKATISHVKAARQKQETESKKVQSRKRQLDLVAQETYEPLKHAAADGHEGAKRLAVLCRAGKAYGFHKELLSIAPVILRKPLDSRHTFEDLCVRQLASEFNKNASSLSANIKDSEQAILECTQQLQAAEEELAMAKAAHRKATQNLHIAEAAEIEAKQALAEAKSCVRRFPTDMKRAARNLALAEARLSKFKSGPLAAFEKGLGLALGGALSVVPAQSSDVHGEAA